MTFDEFKKQLADKPLKRLYLFLGKEGYLRAQAYRLLVDKFTNPASRELNVDKYSLKETSLVHIVDAARTFPMLGQYRLVFVRDVEYLNDGDKKLLDRYLQAPPDTTITVFDAEDPDKGKELYKKLSRKCAVVEFNPLRGQALLRWVQEHLRSQGFSAEFATLQKLIEYTGSDLQTIHSELEKLLTYAGESRQLTAEMIDDLSVRSRHYSIFELIEAVNKKQRRRALQILDRLLDEGEEPLVVLTMFARHFRQLLIAKELLRKRASERDIAREAQIPEFLIGDFIKQAKSFGERQLAQSFHAIAEADLLFKTTSVNQRIYLEQMICRLSR